jgi:hypothetical protein
LSAWFIKESILFIYRLNKDIKRVGKLSDKMKTNILIILLLLTGTGFAQKITIYIGSSLGGNFEKKFEYDIRPRQQNGYIGANISVNYQLSDQYFICMQAMANERFGSFAGAGRFDEYTTTSTNTIIKNNNNLNTTSLFLRNQYTFPRNKYFQYFVNAGIGMTTYYSNGKIADGGSVHQSSFAMSPEVGFQFSVFRFGCHMILGGKTPAFKGFDSERNSNILMNSISSQQLYLTFGYRLFKI